MTNAHDAHANASPLDARGYLKHAVEHFCHMLSEQGPMSITFVHNNTLLGLQKSHFEVAIKEAERFLGGRGYLENAEFRRHHKNGRITAIDIERALRERGVDGLDSSVLDIGEQRVVGIDLLSAHMVHGIDAIDPAELRYRSLDRREARRLRSDLSPRNRDALLASAAVDLAARVDAIGRSVTMSQWLTELTGLDITRTLVAAVDGQLSGKNAFAAAVEPNLRALGIVEERWRSYLDCIDAQLTNEHGSETQQAEMREIWLREEAALVNTLAQRHFGLAGTVEALGRHFGAHLEEYAALVLWRASLRLLGLGDPLAVSDAEHLIDHNPDASSVDMLSEQIQHMHRWGGPPIPISAAERSALERLIGIELETAREGSQAADMAASGAAHLCWLVLHDLGPQHLNRRGMEALQALALGGTEQVELKALLERLHERDPRQQMAAHLNSSLDAEIAAFAHGRAHADLLQSLTGDDLSERVNQYVIRICSAFFDEGLAAWHMPARALGFFDAWRSLAEHERTFDFDQLAGWREALHQLPTRPDDAVMHCLAQLGIDRENWGEYLGRLLVRLKGWAGMAFWRELHPKYVQQATTPVDVMQFLAVRLFYETLLVRDTCRRTWQIQPDLASLAHHLRAHLPEYLVRRELFAGRLSDGLAEEARALVEDRSLAGRVEDEHWIMLADMVWASRAAETALVQAADCGWRLHQSLQLLGVGPVAVRSLDADAAQRVLGLLDGFAPTAHGPVWLNAFERHYRDEILNAMRQNHGRGRWLRRNTRPKSQVILCIDEREEAFHRHYEEIDPGHETFGAAGFFGIAMNYTSLDDHATTPLCPAVVSPAHRVYEIARPEAKAHALPIHKSRAKWKESFDNAYWEMKRNLVSSYFLIDVVGFLMALPLLGRVFFPTRYFAMMGAGRSSFVPHVTTRLAISRDDAALVHDHGHEHAAGTAPMGFTDTEQADRCETMLRNIGLTSGFAPIVVWCAHGSHSENNPHENAHDCGACGGKNGGPNARAISAMLNRPVVRTVLRERGIDIPSDSWFVGGVHNTCSDEVTLFDTQDVPTALRSHFEGVRADLHQASMRSAHERCRRFGSSPKDASLEVSAAHILGRAYDFSQVRPEWGHATNAFAVVGRRAVTQGVFFDRRPFIISYDPNADESGKILERILMAVGPVGAGISLEYYFSTVDPKVYGCDTKVPHNVTGLIGVMEGAHSDLRTGLPRQMTEVHEAMRLQLVVDAPMARLGEIYGRQPAIQELLNGQWVHLIAHDPETGAFNMFVPGTGFVEWNEPLQPLPEVANSADWYRGKYEGFLSPALIAEPKASWRSTGSVEPHQGQFDGLMPPALAHRPQARANA